ncbi:O-antigen ligase family protein, partial [bacterium]|nr:O-antigen ligase family protein [bacterium]
FTFARGPWIGLFGGMLFLGFLRDKRILIILAAVLVFFSLLLPDSVISRAKSMAELQSQELRISDWRVALNMIEDYPFSGIGLGDAYLTTAPKYKPGHLFRRPHNLYLYQAVAVGIPGLVVYIWLLLSFFRSGLRILRAGGKEGTLLLASILAGVVGILIASLTDEHFHASEVSMTFWFLMGLGIILTNPKESSGY